VHGELNASSVVVTYPRADRPLVKVLGLCVASPREEEVSDTRTLSPDRAMFLSPEQARGEPADGRADVYSACVLLYLLLTGERPFAGPSWREVVHQIVHGEVKPLLQVNPALPKDLADVLSSGLKLNASERIGTVEELAQRLRSFASALTPASPRPSVLAQARQGITLIAAKPSAVPARGSTAPISSLRRADLASRLVTDSVLVSPRLPKPPAPPNLEVGRDFLPLLGDPERNEEIEHTAVTKASSRVRAKLSAALAILAGFAVGVLLAWLVGLI
jgi:serine/threonine protein kinase